MMATCMMSFKDGQWKAKGKIVGPLFVHRLIFGLNMASYIQKSFGPFCISHRQSGLRIVLENYPTALDFGFRKDALVVAKKLSTIKEFKNDAEWHQQNRDLMEQKIYKVLKLKKVTPSDKC